MAVPYYYIIISKARACFPGVVLFPSAPREGGGGSIPDFRAEGGGFGPPFSGFCGAKGAALEKFLEISEKLRRFLKKRNSPDHVIFIVLGAPFFIPKYQLSLSYINPSDKWI